jgi:hypothetical protein
MNTTKKIKKGGNNKNKTKKEEWGNRFREVLKGFKASEDEWTFLPNQKGTLIKSDDIPVSESNDIPVSQAPESDDIPALSTNLKQAPKPFRNRNVKIPPNPFGHVKIPPQPKIPPPQAPRQKIPLQTNLDKIYETEQSKQEKEEFYIPLNQTEIIEEKDKENIKNYCKKELVLASRFLFHDFEIDPSFYFNPDKTLDIMYNKISLNLKNIYKRISDCFADFKPEDTYQTFFTRVKGSITYLDCKTVHIIYRNSCLYMNVVIILLKNYLTYSEYIYYALYLNQNKQPPPIERDHDKEKKVLQQVLKNEETNLSEAQQVLKNGQQLNERNSVIYSPVPKNQTIQEDNNENNTSPENDTSLKYNTSEYSFVISIKNNGGTVSIFVYKVKSNKITEITEILKRRKDLFFNKYSVNKDKTGEIVQTKDNQRYKFSSRDDYTLIHDVNNNVKSFDNKNNDVEYSYVISSKDDDDETVSVFICNLSSDEIREINERDILKDLKSTKYFVQGDKKTVTVQENTVQNYGLHNNPNLSELFYEKRPIGPNGGKKRKTFKRKTKILKRKTFKKHKRHNRTTK